MDWAKATVVIFILFLLVSAYTLVDHLESKANQEKHSKPVEWYTKR